MKSQMLFSKKDKKLIFINQMKEKIKINFQKSFNYSNKIILLLKIIIGFLIIAHSSAYPIKLRQIESYYSAINLTIVQRGYQTFLGENFQVCPDEVYINDVKYTGEICKVANLNKKKNNQMKLVWFNEIENVDYMFYNLSNITSIDLTQFNASSVNSMNNMFSNCKDLKTITISNIDTSSVSSMEYMFRNCESLNSIDLKSFNTSNVISMKGMFKSCIKLVSLDFSESLGLGTRQLEQVDPVFIVSQQRHFHCSPDGSSLALF